MSTLHIALNDGFADEAVAVRVDGRPVYEKDHVKTDLRISRADGFETEADGRATIEVRARGQSATTEVDPAEHPYVAVNIDSQGRLEIRRSEEPFAYL